MSGKNSKPRKTIQTQLRPGPQRASTHANLDITALRVELLASLRKDIDDIFKKELQDTLWDALSTIKHDPQAVKTPLVIKLLPMLPCPI